MKVQNHPKMPQILATLAAAALWGGEAASSALAQASVNESSVTQTLYVNNQNASASDNNPGTASLPLRTIQGGINNAGASINTKISILPGTYREMDTIPSGSNVLVLEASQPGTVFLSGADQVTNWTNEGGGVYSVPWNNAWGLGPTNGWNLSTAYNLRREAVYLNDQRLTQICDSSGNPVATSSLTAGQMTVSESAHKIYFVPPSGVSLSSATDVEVVNHGWRGSTNAGEYAYSLLDIQSHSNVVLRGLTVLRDANHIEFNAAVNFHSTGSRPSNLLVDNCTFNQNNGIGFQASDADNITVQNSRFNDNGERGGGATDCGALLVQDSQCNGNNWRDGVWGASNDAAGWKNFSNHTGQRSKFLRCQFNGNFTTGQWNDYANDATTEDHCLFEYNTVNGMDREMSVGMLDMENCVIRYNAEHGLISYGSPGITLNNCYLYGSVGNTPAENTYASEIYLVKDERAYGDEFAATPVNFGNWVITNSVLVATNPSANLFYEDSTLPKTSWLATLKANNNRYYRRDQTGSAPGNNQFWSPTDYRSYLNSYTDINFAAWQAQSNTYGHQDLNSVYADTDLSNVADPTLISGGGSLPSGVSQGDVGGPSPAGSATYSAGTYTVSGGGGDVWGGSDQFHFVYQSLTGDGTLIARVVSQTNTNSWAKAGVMMRNTLDAGSYFADVVATPGNGTGFQLRDGSSPNGFGGGSLGSGAPVWVKLVRSGTTVSGFASTDGVSWGSSLGTWSSASGTIYTGLAVTSHNNGTSSTATFDNLSLTTGAGTLVDRTSETGGIIQARGDNAAGNEGKDKAFDNDPNSKWLDVSGTSWISYQFAGSKAYVITQYKVTSGNDTATYPGRALKSWVLRGSNDGTSWTPLDTQANVADTANADTRVYNFSNTTSYKIYKLDNVVSNGDGLIQMDELRLLGPAGSGTAGATARLNAGGGAAGAFAADANFTGGNTATVASAIDTSAANAAPAAVYQSERWGNSTYTIPGLTAGTSYTVRLHFAETYWTATGKRKFNVALNGASVLSDFDVFAAAGAANKAVVRDFTATANSSGQIVIALTQGSVDQAKISGIEVF